MGWSSKQGLHVSRIYWCLRGYFPMFSREALENLCRCHAQKKPRVHVQGPQDRVCKTYRLYRIILSTSVPLRGGGLLCKTIGFLAPGVRDLSWSYTGNSQTNPKPNRCYWYWMEFSLWNFPSQHFCAEKFGYHTLFTGNFLVICGHRCGSQLGAGLPVGREARQNSAVEEVTPY